MAVVGAAGMIDRFESGVGGMMFRNPGGEWVKYSEHLAEVVTLQEALNRLLETCPLARINDRAYQSAKNIAADVLEEYD